MEGTAFMEIGRKQAETDMRLARLEAQLNDIIVHLNTPDKTDNDASPRK